MWVKARSFSMQNPAPLLLPATRPRRTWPYLGLGLAGTAAGFWQIREGNAAGWFPLALFGLGNVVLLLQMLARGNHLRLDQDGFTVVMLLGSRSRRWSEVDRFFVGHAPYAGHGGRGDDVVVFDLAPSQRRSLNQRLERLARRWFGYHAALPQTYGMTPQRLADLMNDWKTRVTGVPPAAAGVVVDQDGVRRRLPDGREETVRWDVLAEVAICTTPDGPWEVDVFFLLTGRDGGGCAVPHGEAVDRDLLRWLQALPGFDNQQVIEAMGRAEDAVFVCWRRPDPPGGPQR
jgi:hypothetical protein